MKKQNIHAFVEYRLPIKKPLLVFRIGTEIVFDLK
jgi:hypothetical protein